MSLEISDTGIGMTKEMIQRCFDPFFSTKGEKGTGLGLSVVHGIIRRHKGSIKVQSELDKGTTFIICLPKGKQSNREFKPERKAKSEPLHVLVVDDEPMVRDILAEYLANDGHIYEIAENGTEGLRKFQNSKFDVVITDRAMPDMSGDQLALLLRQISPKTPIVMLTGFGDIMAASGESPEGIDCILGKPIDLPKFQETLARIKQSISS